MKPAPEVLGILMGGVELAQMGEIREVFIVCRMADGEYAHYSHVEEMGAMRLEVRAATWPEPGEPDETIQ